LQYTTVCRQNLNSGPITYSDCHQLPILCWFHIRTSAHTSIHASSSLAALPAHQHQTFPPSLYPDTSLAVPAVGRPIHPPALIPPSSVLAYADASLIVATCRPSRPPALIRLFGPSFSGYLCQCLFSCRRLPHFPPTSPFHPDTYLAVPAAGRAPPPTSANPSFGSALPMFL
jgi:hypothetical protein